MSNLESIPLISWLISLVKKGTSCAFSLSALFSHFEFVRLCSFLWETFTRISYLPISKLNFGDWRGFNICPNKSKSSPQKLSILHLLLWNQVKRLTLKVDFPPLQIQLGCVLICRVHFVSAFCCLFVSEAIKLADLFEGCFALIHWIQSLGWYLNWLIHLGQVGGGLCLGRLVRCRRSREHQPPLLQLASSISSKILISASRIGSKHG